MPVTVYEVIVVENGTAELSDVDGLGGVTRYLHVAESNSASPATPGWPPLGAVICC